MKTISLAAHALAAAGVAAETHPNFVVIMAEAQGWAQTSVAMDDRVPQSKSRGFRPSSGSRAKACGSRLVMQPRRGARRPGPRC